MSFKNKVIVITGGSDGIGKCLMEQFIKEGAKVSICGTQYEKLYAIQAQYTTSPILTYMADISKESDCKNFILNTIKAFGQIDILINNAGISMYAAAEEVEIDTLKKIIDVNFWGTVYCTQFALPYIIASKGNIVGISSILGLIGYPYRTGYCASKHAINGYLKALRLEMLDKDVHVMWTCPNVVQTNIRSKLLNKIGKQQKRNISYSKEGISAQECATILIEGIRERKRVIYIQKNKDRLNEMIASLFPNMTDRIIIKKFKKQKKETEKAEQ